MRNPSGEPVRRERYNCTVNFGALFRALFRANMQGVAVCETVAETSKGDLVTHYVVADFWRRLVFLGAGELTLQWLAGIISVRGDDRQLLDERLRGLRIRSLTSVRMLWVQSERVRAPEPAPRPQRLVAQEAQGPRWAPVERM